MLALGKGCNKRHGIPDDGEGSVVECHRCVIVVSF
jgi:hypothetical protein